MKLSRFAVALWVTACVATASLPSRAAELLTNGSFEDVKDGATVGWNSVGRKYVYGGVRVMIATTKLLQLAEIGCRAYPPRPKAEPQSGLDAGCKSAAEERNERA